MRCLSDTGCPTCVLRDSEFDFYAYSVAFAYSAAAAYVFHLH